MVKNQAICDSKKWYSKIDKAWCPLLNEYVTFNNIGFRHLMRKGRKPRPRRDQERRLRLLPLARGIVENSRATLLHNNETAGKRTKFWAIVESDKEKVTVIIRQVGNGKKHFFSIYNQKIAR